MYIYSFILRISRTPFEKKDFNMKCLIQYIIHSKDKYALIPLLNYVNMIIIILWQEGYDSSLCYSKMPKFFAYNFHKKIYYAESF